MQIRLTGFISTRGISSLILRAGSKPGREREKFGHLLRERGREVGEREGEGDGRRGGERSLGTCGPGGGGMRLASTPKAGARELRGARPLFLLPPQGSVGRAGKTRLSASPRPEPQVRTLCRLGRRVHLQGSGVAWYSPRVEVALASCTRVQCRRHDCGPCGSHL